MYSSEEKNTREYWLIYKCISHCISRLVPRLTNYEQPSYFCVFPQGWRRWFVPAASSRPITFSNTALRHPVRMPNRVHHLARSSHLTNRPTKAHYHVTVRPHSMSSTRPLHDPTTTDRNESTTTKANDNTQRQTTNDNKHACKQVTSSRHAIQSFSRPRSQAVRSTLSQSTSQSVSQFHIQSHSVAVSQSSKLSLMILVNSFT